MFLDKWKTLKVKVCGEPTKSGHIQDMKKNDFQPCSFTQKTVNVSYEYQNLPEIQKSFLDQLPI